MPTPATPFPAAPLSRVADFADLRFKAELIPDLCAANWLAGTADDGCDIIVDAQDNEVCYTTNSLNAEEYGQYIAAANPAAILRILAALDHATAQLREARQELAEAEVEKLLLIRELAAACAGRHE